MRTMDLNYVVEVTGARIYSTQGQSFSGIGTDTRNNLNGQLFIALKGEAFDAHYFLEKAVEQGAAALLVHKEMPILHELKRKVTILLVPDTLKALQKLGTAARREAKAKVIAITGSNGKTTTKEFCAALIGTARDVHYNKGSFNNHWGVPFTLLQLAPQKEVAIVEMGMNHAGEITDLVHIAEPDVVLCTMVGRAHMEYFGTIEKVAEAKEEIYEAAQASAVRVYNLDNEQTKKMYSRAKERFRAAKILTFSSHEAKANVYLKIDSMNMQELVLSGHIENEKGQVRVAVFGQQNVTNLMAAAAAALAIGMSSQEIWKGLAACRTNWGRNQLLQLKSGAQMIFDGYNANPDSMAALLENMKMLSTNGKKIGIFGQMLELGSLSEELHQELGEKVGAAGFDSVYFIGVGVDAFRKGLEMSQFKGKSRLQVAFSEQMALELSAEQKNGDILLVKGSRGMKLERFVLPCEPLNFSLEKT